MADGRQNRGERNESLPNTNPDNAYDSILAQIRASANSSSHTVPTSSPSTTFDELIQNQKLRTKAIANDKKQAEIDSFRQTQALKKLTLILLFILLFAESALLFILAFFQGFKLGKFNLDPITLRIIVVATLLQISAMLTIAVRHLFPAIKPR